MSDKQYYAYRLNPPRPSFFADQTDEERAIMARHVRYWTANLAAGHAVAFGPVLDPAGVWGLAVIETDSQEQAEQLRDSDPAVATGLATVDIFRMPQAVVRTNE